MQAILTFDIGTTACKTMLFDLEGNVLVWGEQEYPLYHPQPYWAEQDADDWWQAAITTTKNCLVEYTAKHKSPLEILAIGLSSQRETIVALDQEGRKLGKAVVWMDRRAKAEAEALAAEFGRSQLHQRTGMIPDSTFSATKLFWWQRHDPAIIKEAVTFLQPKEYVAYQLTGAFATDYSLASRTMLLDTRKRSWCEDILAFIGVKAEQLPPLVYSDTVIGKVSKNAAALLGIQPGIPVVAGGGDRQCEALGAGIYGDRAMESTGTTSNISCASSRIEHLDPRVVCSIHVLRDQWLLEQGMTTTGSIMRWFRDTFCRAEIEASKVTGESAYTLISNMVEQSPAGAKKLLLLPFFMGAKATRWNPDARGALLGLSLDTNRADLARAIMEGVAFELRACLNVLLGMDLNPKEIILMGGGARSKVWNQIKADMSGIPVRLPRLTDTASLGAMILAATGIGLFPDAATASRTLNPTTAEFTPNAKAQAVYAQLFPIYDDFYCAVEALYTRLAQLDLD